MTLEELLGSGELASVAEITSELVGPVTSRRLSSSMVRALLRERSCPRLTGPLGSALWRELTSPLWRELTVFLERRPAVEAAAWHKLNFLLRPWPAVGAAAAAEPARKRKGAAAAAARKTKGAASMMIDVGVNVL